MPSSYYMNKQLREICDRHDIDPPSYPFKKVLYRMKDKMKNGDDWLAYSLKNIYSDTSGSKFIIEHVDGCQYECMAEPLIDDAGHSWGRMCMVTKLRKKRKKTGKK